MTMMLNVGAASRGFASIAAMGVGAGAVFAVSQQNDVSTTAKVAAGVLGGAVVIGGSVGMLNASIAAANGSALVGAATGISMLGITAYDLTD